MPNLDKKNSWSEKHIILVIDDEEENCKYFYRILRREYAVIQAFSGEEGLERLQEQENVAVIITDMRMPGIKGDQVLIEAKKTHPHAVGIVVTGYADTEAAVSAINKGQAFNYLSKPVTQEKLLSVVKNAIEAYQKAKMQSNIMDRVIDVTGILTPAHIIQKPLKLKGELLKAKSHSHQLIKCSVLDQFLQNLPVPVVFFYKKAVDPDLLKNSLQKTLEDFPLFSGRLKVVDGRLYIDCNNTGVSFSIKKQDITMDQLLEKLFEVKKELLIDIIRPKEALSSQGPVFSVKINYFSCGGMSLGLCWHHSIGDMHTFMQFMRAWSNITSGKSHFAPLIVEKRDDYFQKLVKDDNSTGVPNIRYLSLKEMLQYALYIMFSGKKQLQLSFYFTDEELIRMKNDMQDKTDQKLSTNDVLCAHVFSTINQIDDYKKQKYLSIAVNVRSRLDLPQNLLGNCVQPLDLLCDPDIDPVSIATNIRKALNNFKQDYRNLYFLMIKFVREHGDVNKIGRFIPKALDPINRNLLISSWSNFGVYEISFLDVYPFLFFTFGEYPFPWISSIFEGFSRTGLIYNVFLPTDLGNKIIQKDSLTLMHKYRSDKDKISETISRLSWLL